MDKPVSSITVIQPGLFSTIQDKGRFGLRHLGIPWAGALCPAWQEIANAMVGNDRNAPVIECFEGGLQLQANERDVLLAVVGSSSAIIKKGSNTQTTSIQANHALSLSAGETLFLSSTGGARHAIVAIAGISVPDHLGSTSTYAKASLGGIDGSTLSGGTILCISNKTRYAESSPYVENQCQLPEMLHFQSHTLRLMAGPQFDHFSDSGIHTFLSSEYTLGMEADRMGVRLQGPVIEHRDKASKDIISDAILPGSIQVPGTGLPIVLLNDAHTAGGYPKIATLISCDLPLLGLQRAGATFRFKLVDIDEAITASAYQRTLIDSTIDSIRPHTQARLDSETLLKANLIDGVVNGS